MKTFELLVIGAVFILTWPAVVFAEFTFTSIDVYMKLHQDGDEKREFSDEDETTVVHQLTSPLGTEFSVDFDLDLTHDQAWLDFEMSFDATSSGVKGSYVGMISTAMEYSVRVDGDVEVDWDFAYSGPTPFGLQTIRILINGVLWKVLGSFGLSGTHQGIHSISVLAGSTVSVQTLFNPNAAGDIFLLDGSSSGTIHYSFPGCGQEPPQVHCPLLNIIPPDAKQSDPVSFEISATSDGCGEPELKLLDYECWKMNPKGKRVDKTGCSVEIEGSTVKILNSGGVGTFIGVSAMATDLDGKTTTVSTEECRLQVLRPGIRH